MASIFPDWILILTFLFINSVLCLPFDPLSGKTGEDQVKEAVHQAELAAGKAALQSEKNGNSAELRVAAIKAKLAAQHAIKQQIKKMRKEHLKDKPLRKWGHLAHVPNEVKSYEEQSFRPMPRHHFRRPSHRKGFSKMISLDDLTTDNAHQNNYHEDTTLEDRLALEAEEDKKYGGLSDSGYGSSRSSLLDQDASQSIQNQVASESARELKQIQQQINAESQNSLGKTTIGQAPAVLQGETSQRRVAQQKATARNGMIDVQSDLNNAFGNAEGMNADSNIASPQDNGNENNIGANAFTGLGEETQPNNLGMDMPGLSSLINKGRQTEQSEMMGQGTASMEGQQDRAQSAMSALAAGGGASLSNPQPQTPNDIGGLGGPGAAMEATDSEQLQSMQAFNANNQLGGSRMAEAKMLSGGSTGSNLFGGNSMKKSKIHGEKQS